MDKIEIKGEWFFPNKIDRRFSGTLVFDPQKGAELELYVSFKNEPESNVITIELCRDQKIILGHTNDNQLVTLYRCNTVRNRIKYSIAPERKLKQVMLLG